MHQQQQQQKKADVIIVGAGISGKWLLTRISQHISPNFEIFSGLSAAEHLRRNGVMDVVILEASNRFFFFWLNLFCR